MPVVIRATSKSLASSARRTASPARGVRRRSLAVVMVSGWSTMLHLSFFLKARLRRGRLSAKQSGESGVPDSPLDLASGSLIFNRRDPEKFSEFGLFCWGRIPGRDHGHIGAVLSLGDELHRAGGLGEQGVVASKPYIVA